MGESDPGESESESESEPDPNPDPDPEPEPEPEEPEPDPTGVFVPDHDFPGGCECDPFAQDCPEGEKCTAYDSNGDDVYDANLCVPVEEVAVGERCSSEGKTTARDSCDEHGACFGLVEGEGEDAGMFHGTCRAFCGGTADDPICPEGEVCMVGWEGSVNLCMPGCDPVLQDCVGDDACHHTQNGQFACLPGDPSGTASKPCAYFDECATGYICLIGEVLPTCEGDSCCSSYCEFDSEQPQCEGQPGTVCAPFYGDEGTPPPQLAHIGVCIMP